MNIPSAVRTNLHKYRDRNKPISIDHRQKSKSPIRHQSAAVQLSFEVTGQSAIYNSRKSLNNADNANNNNQTKSDTIVESESNSNNNDNKENQNPIQSPSKSTIINQHTNTLKPTQQLQQPHQQQQPQPQAQAHQQQQQQQQQYQQPHPQQSPSDSTIGVRLSIDSLSDFAASVSEIYQKATDRDNNIHSPNRSVNTVTGSSAASASIPVPSTVSTNPTSISALIHRFRTAPPTERNERQPQPQPQQQQQQHQSINKPSQYQDKARQIQQQQQQQSIEDSESELINLFNQTHREANEQINNQQRSIPVISATNIQPEPLLAWREMQQNLNLNQQQHQSPIKLSNKQYNSIPAGTAPVAVAVTAAAIPSVIDSDDDLTVQQLLSQVQSWQNNQSNTDVVNDNKTTATSTATATADWDLVERMLSEFKQSQPVTTTTAQLHPKLPYQSPSPSQSQSQLPISPTKESVNDESIIQQLRAQLRQNQQQPIKLSESIPIELYKSRAATAVDSIPTPKVAVGSEFKSNPQQSQSQPQPQPHLQSQSSTVPLVSKATSIKTGRTISIQIQQQPTAQPVAASATVSAPAPAPAASIAPIQPITVQTINQQPSTIASNINPITIPISIPNVPSSTSINEPIIATTSIPVSVAVSSIDQQQSQSQSQSPVPVLIQSLLSACVNEVVNRALYCDFNIYQQVVNQIIQPIQSQSANPAAPEAAAAAVESTMATPTVQTMDIQTQTPSQSIEPDNPVETPPPSVPVSIAESKSEIITESAAIEPQSESIVNPSVSTDINPAVTVTNEDSGSINNNIQSNLNINDTNDTDTDTESIHPDIVIDESKHSQPQSQSQSQPQPLVQPQPQIPSRPHLYQNWYTNSPLPQLNPLFQPIPQQLMPISIPQPQFPYNMDYPIQYQIPYNYNQLYYQYQYQQLQQQLEQQQQQQPIQYEYEYQQYIVQAQAQLQAQAQIQSLYQQQFQSQAYQYPIVINSGSVPVPTVAIHHMNQLHQPQAVSAIPIAQQQPQPQPQPSAPPQSEPDSNNHIPAVSSAAVPSRAVTPVPSIITPTAPDPDPEPVSQPAVTVSVSSSESAPIPDIDIDSDTLELLSQMSITNTELAEQPVLQELIQQIKLINKQVNSSNILATSISSYR